MLQNLKVHMQTHVPEHLRSFKCDICTRGFVTEYRLKHHVRSVHCDESDKKFSCNQCEYKWVSYITLFISYILARTRPELNKSIYFSNVCRCISESILRTHVRGTHDGAHSQVCDICGKVCKTKQILQIHRSEIHTNASQPRVQCNVCGSWYNQRYGV